MRRSASDWDPDSLRAAAASPGREIKAFCAIDPDFPDAGRAQGFDILRAGDDQCLAPERAADPEAAEFLDEDANSKSFDADFFGHGGQEL